MSTVRLLCWNVNGLRAVYKKNFLDWFLKEQPDVLCVQETKATQDQLPEELRVVPGYHVYFDEAVEKKGYSGVALYSKILPKNVQQSWGDSRFEGEGRILIADYETFLLYNIYFPNGKASSERLRYKMDFYESFLDHVRSMVQKGRHVVIAGDVNTAHKEIDLARPKENEIVSGFLPEEREWIDRLIAVGFADTFRMFCSEPGHYTWWDLKSGARARNVGWRIDYFFVSESLRPHVKKASILSDVMGSDHCPIELVLSF